ncbi:MAG: hypothetical protein U0641_02700 [Anaerolineae bacterium]
MIYSIGVVMGIMGRSVEALKVTSALYGILTVLATYPFARDHVRRAGDVARAVGRPVCDGLHGDLHLASGEQPQRATRDHPAPVRDL